MRAPDFWWDRHAPVGWLLAPLGWVYAAATEWRLSHAAPWRAPVPVICVGNLTAGGAGKTPVVRDLAARLSAGGGRPYVLSRGYGGSARGPLLVDPARHAAAEVGDEPLLLARDAPCLVSADRVDGARAIAAAGGTAILMDDGLQNPALAQDLRLVVVDGETGFGNGRAIPAGPLRETVDAGLARAHALILLGADSHGLEAALAGRLPILRARLEAHDAMGLAGAKLVGFAGIGRPGKFHATLRALGADIAGFHAFPDHHPYAERELESLMRDAESAGAALVTTEKDWVRLTPGWRDRIRAVPVRLRWHDEKAVEALLDGIAAHG